MAKPHILRREQALLQAVPQGHGAAMAVLLGPEAGVPHFITRRFVLQPGGRIPAHRHSQVEHEQVVIRGEMVIGLDGKEHLVRAGGAIFIPAGCAHWYENRGTEPVEFICVVPKTEDYATEWLETSAPAPGKP